MNFVKPIRSISFHMTNASGVINPVQATPELFAITVNGKIDAVAQDVESCQRTRDQIALLKMLALGRQEIDAGNVTNHDDFFAELEAEDDEVASGGERTGAQRAM